LITTELKAGIKKQNCIQQEESGLLRNRLRAPNRQTLTIKYLTVKIKRSLCPEITRKLQDAFAK